MASSSTPPVPNPNESDSFTKMSVGDVEAIGAHCQMAFCHQLDFLPFRCESCKGKFCLDHRTETAHDCPQAGAWARRRAGLTNSSSGVSTPKPSLLNHERQCAEISCKTLVDTPLTPAIHCPTCNRSYCLKHRMKEEHDCKNLKPIGARPRDAAQTARESGLAALERLKAWGAGKRAAAASSSSMKGSSSSSSSSGSNAKVATAKGSAAKKPSSSAVASLNQLKAKAKGDDKIPADKRIYLHVEASADTTKAKHPTGDFFYSRDFSVGRVLDIAAKALQVENINNHGGGEAERLRVFHVEGGRLLEFSEKLGETTKSGNTIVLLRGVGPAVPNLIG